MDKKGTMLTSLDRMIRELQKAVMQESRDGASVDQRELTWDVLISLSNARTLLEEK